jgi:hypothetical protein
MRTLEFGKYIFKEGLNLTVRRGDKWDKYSTTTESIVLKSVDKDDPDIEQKGIIVGSTSCRFDIISPCILLFEHDPGCRTQYGLECAMKQVYADFKTNEYVTLLFFLVAE